MRGGFEGGLEGLKIRERLKDLSPQQGLEWRR